MLFLLKFDIDFLGFYSAAMNAAIITMGGTLLSLAEYIC